MFFFDEQDYAFYLQQFQISAEQFGLAFHAFVLMTNHVHLLVTPKSANSCAKMMQQKICKIYQPINPATINIVYAA
jgi:putative transposase